MKHTVLTKIIALLLLASSFLAHSEGIGPGLNVPANGGIVRSHNFYAYKKGTEQVSWVIEKLFHLGAATSPDWTFKVYSPSGVLTNSYTILKTDPTGTTITGTTSSTEVGIWTIEMVNGNGAGDESFSVNVNVKTSAAGTNIAGRVYTDYLWFYSNLAPTFSLYSVNKEGYKYTSTFYGLNPAYYRFEINSTGNVLGATCTSAYKSVQNGDVLYNQNAAPCGNNSKIYFNSIAADVPASAPRYDIATSSVVTEWINPAVAVASVSLLTYVPTSTTTGLAAGAFTFNVANYAGNATLQIDVNNNGLYTDAVDRSIIAGVTAGANTIDFDGKNGTGTSIPCGSTMKAKVTLDKLGEVHFVLDDAEGFTGIQITRTSGAGAPTSLINWDDTNMLAIGKTGNNSVVVGTNVNSSLNTSTHGWAGSWGNSAKIDNWAFVAGTASQEITLATVCPPLGYIYLHKNATDESSSPNFGFTVTGGPGLFNQSYLLNDQHNPIGTRDLGATSSGGLYAIAGSAATGDNPIYFRNANLTGWTSIGFQGTAIDGGPGVTNLYSNAAGTVFYYNGTTSTNLNATNAVDVAFDRSGTSRVFYLNSAGIVFYRLATSGTWTAIPGLTATSIDVAPNGQLVYGTAGTAGTNYQVNVANFNGTGIVNLLTTTFVVQDVAAADDGVIYATNSGRVSRYTGGYATGGTWITDPTSRSSMNITGGVAGQVWAGHNSGNDPYTIYTKVYNDFWIDDEIVTSAANGNSVLIPVPAGTYSVVETGASSGTWNLNSVDIFDPTTNTTASVSTKTSTVNVAVGEVVHLIYRNGLVNPTAVVNTCAAQAFLENFGTGAVGTYGGPLTGQTSYHYSTIGMEDGYYQVNGTSIYGGFSDHTSGDGTGRMMVINASYDQGIFYQRRFTGLLPGTVYSFSAWVLNLDGPAAQPNVTFEVNNPTDGANLATENTGGISTVGVWTQFELSFTATQSTVDLVLRNAAIGGRGNDLAIDDISFSLAKPLQPVATKTDATCAVATGSITVTSPLGASIQYSVNGTTYQTSPIFNGLIPATYSVTARYINSVGCVSTPVSVIVNPSTPPVISPITGDAKPCSGATSPNSYTYASSTAGGVWSVSPNTFATINASTGVLTTVRNAAGTATITYSVTSGVCTSTATFTIAVSPTDCSALPVTLTSFTAKKQESAAKLEWATTQETNSENFEVQHSMDGKSWNIISTVAAKGESKELVKYSYTHANPSNGENLYRLRMVDFDATFAYSRIVSLSFDGTGKAISVYPNPVANVLYLQDVDLKDVREVAIMSLNGKIVIKTNSVSSDGIEVKKLGAGLYLLKITNINGSVSTHKVVISR